MNRSEEEDRPARTFQESLGVSSRKPGGLREAVLRERRQGAERQPAQEEASDERAALIEWLTARPKDEFGKRERAGSTTYRIPTDLRARLAAAHEKHPAIELQRIFDVAIARLLDDIGF